MIKTTNGIYYVTATRFNDTTWMENQRFRTKTNYQGCVYGLPKQVPVSIQKDAKMYVFEMNNTKPCKIMGVGILYNTLRVDKKYKIYEDHNYNRFCYIGKYRFDRDVFHSEDEQNLLKDIENIVFKGYDHIKRGNGITSFPKKKVVKNIEVLKRFIQTLDARVLDIERFESERIIDNHNDTDTCSNKDAYECASAFGYASISMSMSMCETEPHIK